MYYKNDEKENVLDLFPSISARLFLCVENFLRTLCTLPHPYFIFYIYLSVLPSVASSSDNVV